MAETDIPTVASFARSCLPRPDLDPGTANSGELPAKALQEIHKDDLQLRYQQARALEDAHDWSAAASSYSYIVEASPTYQDAAIRYEACVKPRNLITMLRVQLDPKDWWTVRAIMKELKNYDLPIWTAKSFTVLSKLQLHIEVEPDQYDVVLAIGRGNRLQIHLSRGASPRDLAHITQIRGDAARRAT